LTCLTTVWNCQNPLPKGWNQKISTSCHHTVIDADIMLLIRMNQPPKKPKPESDEPKDAEGVRGRMMAMNSLRVEHEPIRTFQMKRLENSPIRKNRIERTDGMTIN